MPVELAPRLALAQLLTAGSKAPAQIVEGIAEATVDAISQLAASTLNGDTKEQILTRIKVDNLANVNSCLANAFCYYVLVGFNDNEIHQMLSELRKNGKILNSEQMNRINELEAANHNAIIESIYSSSLEKVPSIVNQILQIV